MAEALFSEQLEHCRELSRRYPKDDVVSKALRSAEAALEQMKSSDTAILQSSEPYIAKEALQSYTQSVLDSTYHRECQLVEGGFPNDITQNEISAIICCISRAVSLCGSMEHIQSLLGTEQLECINWRIGALMYMYIHELMSSDERRASADNTFVRECCMMGVCHLCIMLSVRAPLNPNEDHTSHDATVTQLLQEGIFSDVHMLALMYAGELCYWAWEVSSGSEKRREGEGTDTGPSRAEKPEMDCVANERGASSNGEDVAAAHSTTSRTQPPSNLPLFSGVLSQIKGEDFVRQYCTHFSPTLVGRTLLERYVMLAQGPLKEQNWSYERAVHLIAQLKTDHCESCGK